MNKADFIALPPSERLATMERTLAYETIPATVFGPDPDQARHVFRHLAKLAHPDAFTEPADKNKAEQVFTRLSALWEDAKSQIESVGYGQRTLKIGDLTIGGNEYGLLDLLGTGDIADCHLGLDYNGQSVVFKIVNDPANSDLMANEAEILKRLQSLTGWDKANDSLPNLRLAFEQDGRSAHLLDYASDREDPDHLFSLREVGEFFNQRLSPKHIGWLWRRILTALSFSHYHGIIHGGITPDNLLVDAPNHGIVLIDWIFASFRQVPIQALSQKWMHFYPPEIMRKEPPLPSLDIYMAAQSMLWTCENMPDAMRDYFSRCLWAIPEGRPYRLSQLDYDWRMVLHRDLGWPKEFVPLSLAGIRGDIDWAWWHS